MEKNIAQRRPTTYVLKPSPFLADKNCQGGGSDCVGEGNGKCSLKNSSSILMLKETIIRSSLKNPSLSSPWLGNFWPVSSLSLRPKVPEQVVASQLWGFLKETGHETEMWFVLICGSAKLNREICSQTESVYDLWPCKHHWKVPQWCLQKAPPLPKTSSSWAMESDILPTTQLFWAFLCSPFKLGLQKIAKKTLKGTAQESLKQAESQGQLSGAYVPVMAAVTVATVLLPSPIQLVLFDLSNPTWLETGIWTVFSLMFLLRN